MRSSYVTKTMLTSAALALAITPAMAEKAKDLSYLVGARAAGGETELQSRGFEYVTGKVEGGDTKVSFYWDAGDKDCVRVDTYDGRYTSITDASHSDCNQKSSGNGAAIAAAAIGAAALGAILLSRKSKDRPDAYQDVEVYGVQSGSARIFANPSKTARVRRQVREGSILRNYGCDNYEGESWCEVANTNGRNKGWARDRYLRPVGHSGGNSGPDWGYSQPAAFQDLIGSRAAGAMDELSRRGFVQVDNFTSGTGRYSIQWRAASRQCIQAIVANGRLENATDIQTHPRCR